MDFSHRAFVFARFRYAMVDFSPGSDLEGGRVHQLLEFCLGKLLESLDTEEDPELLMTAAQACKRCVYYACVRWELHTEGDAMMLPCVIGFVLYILGDNAWQI